MRHAGWTRARLLVDERRAALLAHVSIADVSSHDNLLQGDERAERGPFRAAGFLVDRPDRRPPVLIDEQASRAERFSIPISMPPPA
jgi:hypothetical protein